MYKTGIVSRNHQGFTLIELMMTLSILAVLSFIATPALSHALEQQKLKQATIELKANLQQARGQAVLVHHETIFCFSDSLSEIAVEQCRQQLKSDASLSTLQQVDNVFLMVTDSKVSVKKESPRHIVFSEQGYTTQQNISLCAGDSSYRVTIYMPGYMDVIKEGACS